MIVTGIAGCSGDNKAAASSGAASSSAASSASPVPATPTASPAAAGQPQVTLGGQPQNVGGPVVCSMTNGKFSIAIGDMLTGEREHGLREERQRFDVHRQFAGAGAEEIAGDADVVAQVEELIERESLFAHRVEPHVDLEALSLLLQGSKPGFALRANGHNASRHSHRRALSPSSSRGLVPLCPHLGQRNRRLVLPRWKRLG